MRVFPREPLRHATCKRPERDRPRWPQLSRISITLMTTATAAHPLRTSIQDRTAKLGVVGLGYVGLPLAMLYSRAGFPVLGFDIDASKIATLNAGRSYIQRILPQEIQELRDNGFSAT